MHLLIRWMAKEDLRSCLFIEACVFPSHYQWEFQDFEKCFNGGYYGLVAVLDELVVGYILVKCHRSLPSLVSVAVHPALQRRGVATALIQEVVKRYPVARLRAFVPDTMSIAHYWLRALGWKAVKVHGKDRDSYEFHWNRPKPQLLRLDHQTPHLI